MNIKDIEYEAELNIIYSRMISNLIGISLREAKILVRQAIEQCKKESIEDGWANAPDNYGELLLNGTKSGDEWCKNIVEKAYEDGATDEDIVEWWNMPDLQRKMVIWSENLFRMATWLHLKDKGLSDEQTAFQINNIFPKYRYPDTPRDKGDVDAYLCQEIRGRVDKYQETHDSSKIVEEVKGFSSYNAWVRSKIKIGEL